jgi:hypothetical protein
MRKIALVIAAVFLVASIMPAIALAGPFEDPGRPENPNCWGVVSSQFAQVEPGLLGDHASNPPFDTTPDRPGRGGQGNTPFGHPSNAGTSLAAIDGLQATECP